MLAVPCAADTEPGDPLPPRQPLAICPSFGAALMVEAGLSGPEAWSTSPSRVEDRPLASFAAEPDNSIVPNAWSAPAAPYPSLPAAGRAGEGACRGVCGTSRPKRLMRALL